MFEESEAWRLWTLGLEHWREGRLPEAVATFRDAIGKAEARDIALAEYHQCLGQVLDEIGQPSEAESAFASALEISVKEHGDNAAAQVTVAQYFLADHFVRAGKFREALNATELPVSEGAPLEGLLHYARARAFYELGEFSSADREAGSALQQATSAEQRERFNSGLRHIIGRLSV
ncbi:MAG: hypothetical protein ACXVIJ_03475 [Thermoanaerobaculia bacterium]